ncbi:hypothetical protein ACJJTC_002038 [Scirpophaga incertulas]
MLSSKYLVSEGCSLDNNNSIQSNISDASSELTQEQKEAAKSLENLITLSDLGIIPDKENNNVNQLSDIESPQPSLNLSPPPADFDSDDSVRDQTFNPALERSSTPENSSTSSDDEMHQENTNNNDVVLNTTRKRKGKNAFCISIIPHFRCTEKTQRIRNTGGEPKPRTMNHKYHLKVNGELIEVCKVCFVKTFAISNKCIEVIIKKQSKRVSGLISPDKRGSFEPSNKIGDDIVQTIKNHINSYPLYESHYSRSHTNRRYLPSGLSLVLMYQMYKEKVTSNPVSYTFFGNVFRTMGLSFKKPSLDTCNMCDSYKMKIKLASPQDIETLKLELDTHHLDADSAYAMKKKDKEDCNDVKRVYCFDLQQCFPTPYLKTNVVFYKRQLWTFNLTIYDCFSKKSYCYMWHEADGGRGANQIASCLFYFIKSLSSDIKQITFFSDTCGGQNKNSHVAAMFLCISKMIPDMIIDHKFLNPGHTHMECDSIHAQIERKKKRTDMSIQYMCQEIDFASLFKSQLQLRKFDSTGEKFIWHNVKWFRYNGENELGVKCYDRPLPISQEKKKDLLSILHLIDSDCHDFYKNLDTNSNTRDVDPDLEEFNDL